jgi:ribosomal protein S27E
MTTTFVCELAAHKSSDTFNILREDSRNQRAMITNTTSHLEAVALVWALNHPAQLVHSLNMAPNEKPTPIFCTSCGHEHEVFHDDWTAIACQACGKSIRNPNWEEDK